LTPTDARGALLHCEGVVKHYRGLRPFRLRDLRVAPAERVVMAGFDVVTAELFTNLVNGATLPDEGEVRVAGTSTASVTTEAEWLASLDRFGVVTVRAVLLDGMTVLQNIALPLSIEIDPMSPGLAAQAQALGAEVGIGPEWWSRQVHEAGADVRMRIHLARAIALSPDLLLLEHPTAPLEPEARAEYARLVADVVTRRALTVVACSQDRRFAAAVATRYLQLQPATGELVEIQAG
jgi:ABC-type transporter Mla maintaining outer membrane lipid asymmetry ATPase subunit MlaF